MEVEEEQKIEKTVRRILEKSNMDEVTEHKIRKQASEELELDLSKNPYKAFVKQVVQSFLEEQAQEQEEEQQADDSREYDDEGNPIICKVYSIILYFLIVLFGCLENLWNGLIFKVDDLCLFRGAKIKAPFALLVISLDFDFISCFWFSFRRRGR